MELKRLAAEDERMTLEELQAVVIEKTHMAVPAEAIESALMAFLLGGQAMGGPGVGGRWRGIL
jgi:hypothetical protein